jgi:two-component system, chemotaxis family, sensor kinase CheA
MAKREEGGRKDFISEAEEILESLSGDLHQLEVSVKEKQVRAELINKIFREFHSLKGISAMQGFQSISSFTHELETLLDKLRLGRISLTSEMIGLLYHSLDALTQLITEISREGREKTDTSRLVHQIRESLTGEISAPEEMDLSELVLEEDLLNSLTEYELHRLRESLRSGSNLYNIRLTFDKKTFDRDLRAITELLRSHGEIVSTLPYFDSSEERDRMVFLLIFSTNQSGQSLHQILEGKYAKINNLRKASPEGEPIEKKIEKLGPSLKSLSRTVRIEIQRLDDVMNLVGELVILKSMLNSFGRDLSKLPGMHRYGANLSRVVLDLEKRLRELQRSLVEIRLVPISQIFNRLRRMVRRVSEETNKKIDLQFYGEDIELDKVLIEQLSDPLMHMIINSIDHGIESGEERKKAGKPENGLIQITAFQRGNNVAIQVQDDGRGIQLLKVREQAAKRGLIPKDHMIDMRECIDLIFSPGFSSQEEVTKRSGRGVGLDVVKKNITELRGTIDLTTEQGVGTTIEITLPITLAIIQALIVEANKNRYAIPLHSVSETFTIPNSEIKQINGKEICTFQNKTLPLIRIHDVFKLSGTNHREQLVIVILKLAEQDIGLIVDELKGQEEIVIKSIGERLKNIAGIAGATEIGEKKPILVLDPESIVQKAGGRIRIKT